MAIPLFHVNAFTERPFAGNPAAVCLLPAWKGERWLGAVAREMNLSETAFLVKRADGFNARLDLLEEACDPDVGRDLKPLAGLARISLAGRPRVGSTGRPAVWQPAGVARVRHRYDARTGRAPTEGEPHRARAGRPYR